MMHTLITKDICIRGALVDADIRLHIRSSLAKDGRLKRWASHPHLKHEIETTLAEQAGGM